MASRQAGGSMALLVASLLLPASVQAENAVRTFTAQPGGTGTAVYPKGAYILVLVINAPSGGTLKNADVASQEGVIPWQYNTSLSSSTKAVFGGSTAFGQRNRAWTVATFRVDVVLPGVGPGPATYTVNAFQGAVDIAYFDLASKMHGIKVHYRTAGTDGRPGGTLNGQITSTEATGILRSFTQTTPMTGIWVEASKFNWTGPGHSVGALCFLSVTYNPGYQTSPATLGDQFRNGVMTFWSGNTPFPPL